MRTSRLLAVAGIAVSATSAFATFQEVQLGNPKLIHQYTIGKPELFHSTAPRFDGSTYDNVNTSTFSGFAAASGGASSTASSGGTRFLGDDIQTAYTYAGATLDEFTFSVSNNNTVTVSARARVRFYSNDGAGGAPGTAFGGYSFNPIGFAPGVATFTTGTGLGGTFIGTGTPITQNFWFAIFFDGSNGTFGPAITLARLNQLGQGLFDAPNPGASSDQDFLSTLSGGTNSIVNNPVGNVRNSPFAGNPKANYGNEFSFLGATEVPGPSSLGLIGLAGLAKIRQRRRRI